MYVLPEKGYLRLKQIIGDKSNPDRAPLIPVSSTTWYLGIRKGIYPKGVKISPRVTAWDVEDIRKLINKKHSVVA